MKINNNNNSIKRLTILNNKLKSKENNKKEADLDILFFLDGDNDLTSYMDRHVKELSKLANKYKNINFIVLEDRGVNIKEGWKNAKLFKVKSGKTLDDISKGGISLNNYNDFKMFSSESLSDFIINSQKLWPSKKIGLVLADHGGGFIGINLDKHPHGFMHLPELKKGIKEAEDKLLKKLDFILFDACFMGQIEVDYQLKDLTNYIIHSQDLEKGEGLQYDKIFSNLKINSNLAKSIIDNIDISSNDISTSSLIVLNTDTINNLVYNLNIIGKNLINLSERKKNNIKKQILSLEGFGKELNGNYQALYKNFKDLGQFLNILKNEIKEKEFQNTIKEAIRNYNKLIKVNKFSKDKFKKTTGLSIYIPDKLYNNQYPFNYNRLDIANRMPHFIDAIKNIFNKK